MRCRRRDCEILQRRNEWSHTIPASSGIESDEDKIPSTTTRHYTLEGSFLPRMACQEGVHSLLGRNRWKYYTSLSKIAGLQWAKQCSTMSMHMLWGYHWLDDIGLLRLTNSRNTSWQRHLLLISYSIIPTQQTCRAKPVDYISIQTF